MEKNYNIGLDIGTSSVGWSVTDDNAHLLKIKGKNMWGVRLFDEADTAVARRGHRSSRRRLDRRKQRLNQLQEIFEPEIFKIDRNFFMRMKESFLNTKDNSTLSVSVLFDDSEFTDKEYYEQYPTIYHLRKDLMDCNEKKDIRLIYLALHHILKYRGHFLYGKGELGQGSEDIETSFEQIFSFIIDDDFDSTDINLEKAIKILISTDSKKSKQELLQKIIKHSDKEVNNRLKEMIKAILGYKFDISKLFNVDEEKDSISFKEDVDEVKIEGILHDDMEIFNDLKNIYNWIVLEELLGDIDSKNPKDKTISNAMIVKYNNHGKQLKMLKCLVQEICSKDDYNVLFRDKDVENIYLNYNKMKKNDSFKDFNEYIKNIIKKYPKAKEHKYYNELSKYLDENVSLPEDVDSNDPKFKSRYNEIISKYNNNEMQIKMLKILVKEICSQVDYNRLFRDKKETNIYSNYIKNPKNNSLENLNNNIKNILKKYPKAKEHKYYDKLSKSLGENVLLSKLNTTDNSAIPYQLQKVEMERIIENQGRYYPFLKENKELLLKILVSKLPYYVGPLNRSSEFAWNIPLENNKKIGKVYPWNYEEFIDIDKTATEFIERMTNKCTYLVDEDVLPRYSLLYSEFILLNELNKVRVNDRFISKEVKKEIIEENFKRKKTVKVKDIEKWIRKNPSGFITNKSTEILIEGTQQEDQFATSLGSYYDFQKIFGHVDNSNIKMIEEIIKWITIFEDKDILRRKIKDTYELNDTIIDRIMKLNYSGWARLSKKLINGITAQYGEWTGCTIIEIMRNTNLNFMQILNDNKMNFKETIDTLNPSDKKPKISYEDIKKLQGSPSLKRGIWETVKIIDEIVKIMGSEPENIFIEFARSDEKSIRTTSRIKRMETLYEGVKKDVELYNKDVYDELQNRVRAKDKLDDKALYLYFIQNGKCMYTGVQLEPEQLYKYEIDHIIPRSFIKDDSIDNLVLVTTKANQNKKDDLLLKPETKRKQKDYWNNLYKNGLISKRKLDNLNRDKIPDKELMGFINRQLVETRQISKHVSELLSEVYYDTKIISIKAKLTSDFRKQYKLYKNRKENDYHHAHDALIVSVIGNFVLNRYPYLENELDVKKYIAWYKKEKMHSNNKNKYGFILSSINRDYFSEEFKWVKDNEIPRVKKALSYKDCFITKKVEEQSGEFYNATIYDKDSTKAKIPIKEGLDPKRYGGRSGMNSAYYMIIRYIRKKKEVKKMVGIPRYMAKKDDEFIKEYLVEIEDIQDKETLEILKDKIKKYQLLEYEGHQMYLISNMELQNAVQLVVSDKYKELLYRIYNDQYILNIEEDKAFNDLMLEFLDYFADKLCMHYPFYESFANQIRESKEDFTGIKYEEKLEFIKQMLNITAANSTKGDFKKFKTKLKSTEAGRTRKRSKDGWDIDKIVFIDRSITGIFERRYRV